MTNNRTGPAARHHAYIEPTDRRPEEAVEEVVYSLLSYTPGVGLISRSLEVKHTRRTITDNKFGTRPPSARPEPRRLECPAVTYRGEVDYALRAGDALHHHTAEEIKQAYTEALHTLEESDTVYGISVTDLPGYNPDSGLPGWSPLNFIRLVEIYRPATDRDGVYDADDLGRD
ncbi:hypothetical protein ACWFMI_25150 [Nocardiopsis terrae]|uniref:hypothetical protein n=1 Tax=Streptomyces sp. NPDC057554 TaxID=3350538 RepID=UPI0036B8407C